MQSLDAIELPDDLDWSDRTWSPISQKVEVSLGGSLIVSQSTQSKGRPITLAGTDQFGCITKSTLDALIAKTPTVSAPAVLTLRGGQVFNVIWRHNDGLVIDVTPIFHADERYFQVNALKFLEV